MAKFTRTACAGTNLRDIARELARRAGVDADLDIQMGMHDLYVHKAAGRKRVRITILVEPEQAPPKRPSGPRRAKPVQQALPLDAPEPRPASASPELAHALGRLLDGTKYRMPMHGADGSAT